MGTVNPTFLDIHLYACLSRPHFTKGSVFHSDLYTHMKFDICPNLERFINAMQERQEFQQALSREVTHHTYLQAVKETAAGTKVSFWLPIPYQ